MHVLDRLQEQDVLVCNQGRIQDFSQGRAPSDELVLVCQ